MGPAWDTVRYCFTEGAGGANNRDGRGKPSQKEQSVTLTSNHSFFKTAPTAHGKAHSGPAQCGFIDQSFKSIAQDMKSSTLHGAHVIEFFRVKILAIRESEVPFWGDVVEKVWRREFITLPFLSF